MLKIDAKKEKKRSSLESDKTTARVCIVVFKRLLSQNDVKRDTIERANERTKSNPPENTFETTHIFQLIDGIERGSPTRRRPRTTRTTFRGG